MEDVQVLKQKLIEKISGLQDYEILLLLSEDVEVYETRQKTEGPYDFPGATEEERAELIRIDQGGEIPEDELLTQEEYNLEMSRWHTK